jgi:replicative DNA helicase
MVNNHLNSPHDIDAEEAVVGSFLIDSGAIFRITPPLKVSDFYSERNRLVYEASWNLKERGVSINQITVAEALAQSNNLKDISGAAYLSHLISNCPTSLDCEYYADIVRRLSISRGLIESGKKIIELGQQTDPDIAGTLNKADELLLDVRKMGIPSPIVTPDDRVERLLIRYAKLNCVEGGVALSTGISKLDYALGGGLFNGDMVVLGGRPGLGKTSFMQTIANNIGREKVVLFCSAEMSVEGLSDRDVAGLVNAPISTIRRGGYSEEISQMIGGFAIEEIGKRKVFYYTDTPLTTDRILQAGISMKLRHGLDALMIDYLGLLDDEYGRSPYERVGRISRKISQMSKILDVPVLIAHQLSRDVESRDDKRPGLSDLRDAGNVEQDADVVMFLYRDSYYNKDLEDNSVDVVPTEVLIPKIRQGGGGKMVNLIFNKRTQSYFGSENE